MDWFVSHDVSDSGHSHLCFLFLTYVTRGTQTRDRFVSRGLFESGLLWDQKLVTDNLRTGSPRVVLEGCLFLVSQIFHLRSAVQNSPTKLCSYLFQQKC